MADTGCGSGTEGIGVTYVGAGSVREIAGSDFGGIFGWLGVVIGAGGFPGIGVALG